MTPLAGYVGYALRRAQGVVFADLSQALAPLLLRPVQFTVLLLIEQNPGHHPVLRVRGAGNSKGQLCRNHRRSREPRADSAPQVRVPDARSDPSNLTARGRALLQRALELQSQHEQRLIAQIGPEERLQLLSMLHRLAQLPVTESLKMAVNSRPALPDSQQSAAKDWRATG